MSFVPQIATATPAPVLPGAFSTARGRTVPGAVSDTVGQGHQFAAVMRSAISGGRQSKSDQKSSAARATSPSHSARSRTSPSQSGSESNSSAIDGNVSSSGKTQDGSTQGVSPSAQATNVVVVDGSVSSGVSAQSFAQIADTSKPAQNSASVQARTDEVAGPPVASDKSKASGTSASVGLSGAPDGKKKLSSGANSAQIAGVLAASVSGGSAVAMATNSSSSFANVTVTVTQYPPAKAWGPAAASSAVAGKAGGPNPTAAIAASGNSLVGAADPAATSQNASSSGDKLNLVAAVTERAIDTPPIAAAHREDGVQGDASSHLKKSAEVSLANSSTNGLANVTANGTSSANSAGSANGSNQSTTPIGSSSSNTSASSAASGGGDNGNINGGPAASGNGTSTAVHTGDAAKGSTTEATASTLASAISKSGDGALPSSTPQGPGTPHGNSSDSVAGIHNDSGVFLGSNHSNAAGNPSAQSSNSGATQGTSSDAFTALDSAATGQRGVLLHAAPNQVSVGVADPALGWVEVRAERVAGQVTAALAATSAASHAALTSVLPSMASYLQQQHTGVQHVHVEAGLSGGQSGAGAQGQPSSQSDAGRDSTTTANSRTNSASNWTAAPAGTGAIAAAQGTDPIVEGRRFSIRA